ncbi:hypothetical protein IC580_17655 [Cupriavidus sp. ISTL7]|nr:hypothetical protein IC580_17655 [Cupriavidus sp. ISTL7]
MLRALKRRRRGHAIAGNDYLDAMEGIVAAWCAYDERDLPGALAVLQALAQNQPSATLVQAHPHVRFEWHNLAALIQRSNALAAAPHDAATAGALAEQAATHFDQALAAAFESNVSDAAQHVAANIGMALWLFGEAGIGWSGALRDGEAERAIQWIGLSEWLGRGAGNRHPSAWNAIYLMRIARGACHTAPRPTLAEFQATAPIGVAALRQLAGPFADAFTGPPGRTAGTRSPPGAWRNHSAASASIRCCSRAACGSNWPGIPRMPGSWSRRQRRCGCCGKG